jgi:hypothetical protein
MRRRGSASLYRQGKTELEKNLNAIYTVNLHTIDNINSGNDYVNVYRWPNGSLGMTLTLALLGMTLLGTISNRVVPCRH